MLFFYLFIFFDSLYILKWVVHGILILRITISWLCRKHDIIKPYHVANYYQFNNFQKFLDLPYQIFESNGNNYSMVATFGIIECFQSSTVSKYTHKICKNFSWFWFYIDELSMIRSDVQFVPINLLVHRYRFDNVGWWNFTIKNR